jgi:glycosyltransferase involved in cell wall biosynthesis
MAGVLALVTFKVFPPLMGGQKGVALFYKHLAKHLKVTLAATLANDSDDARSSGVDINPILYPNRKIFLNLTCLQKLKRLLEESSSDVIISEHSYPALIGLWLRKKTGKPLIIHSHNIEALRFRQMGRLWWKAYQAYERWVHRKADFNFFISQQDQDYAISHFGLHPSACAVITYGIEQKGLPDTFDKAALKRSLGFKEDILIFLFNGTLDYAPNLQALDNLLHKIVPLLSAQMDNYKIVITGARATEELINKIESHPSIIYRGLVDDVDLYYRAADLFLNPVTNDSGVKTKVIEALANNCTVVSFAGGATGIQTELCGGKLLSVPNEDYLAFSQQVVDGLKKDQPSTPAAFYECYNWDNIAQKAAALIRTVIP